MLKSLRVIHIHTRDLPQLGTESEQAQLPCEIQGGFYLETCQRKLTVCTEEQLRAHTGGFYPRVSLLSGVAAYSFLVRVAAGLESQVVGETDVFGQLKEAWQKQSACLSKEIQSIFPNVFQDAKEIRSSYLEHLGGVNYGTLVRKYLAIRQPELSPARSNGITLLVGAGSLAVSVAPFLTGREIWISNRSLEKAELLATDLRAKGLQVRVLKSFDGELEGFQKASQVIICVPLAASGDEVRDELRVAAWELNSNSERIALHLGCERERSGVWAEAQKTEFLNDVFEFQKAQGEVRSLKIAQALKACEERAKLRSLGPSMGVYHGWEDLAVFG